MGLAKVFSFFLGWGLTLLISCATVLLAWMTYMRRKERGFLWLFAAVAIQFLGTLLGRIVSSPVMIVDYPLSDVLRAIAFYTPGIASIIGLVGWFFLSRKKEPNQPPEPTRPFGPSGSS